MRILRLVRFSRFSLVCSVKRLESSYSRMKVFVHKSNAIIGSMEWYFSDEAYDYHQEIARSGFADMLHDTERNKKYQRALQLAIEKMHSNGKPANVLDIGTGTGLLSIMAAKAGADSIVACEAFKPMAECCAKILQVNGVADKIKLIPKRSTELTVGENGDMKEKANILVTEVFDTELIGEGALPTFDHAHKYLLEADCIVIPDSAVIYAQVVECPDLSNWNQIHDIVDAEGRFVLITPLMIKNCPGSAAIHDLQLSQFPRNKFRELSDQIPVLDYDWSGRTPIMKKRTVKQEFTVTNDGSAHAVFMWWELNMDTEGKICISCAPWWCHPDTNMDAECPQDTIPWRDHWMQGVYHIPKEIDLTKNSQATIISCQDEYSIWFFLENDENKITNIQKPFCDCGVHMAYSRTHISYLNDRTRSMKFVQHLKSEINSKAVILDVNGSCLMGLAAGVIGAKAIYILEPATVNIRILNEYVCSNYIQNIHFIQELTDEILKEVTHVIGDPDFSRSILPWDNLKVAHIMYKHKDKLTKCVSVTPWSCEIWAMPVEFQHLHKIKLPLGKCEGVDMSEFDKLLESSSFISDAEIESQPLWEYPCKCRGEPVKLLDIHIGHVRRRYATDGVAEVVKRDCIDGDIPVVNGFALWAMWDVAGLDSSGPTRIPMRGQKVEWYPHTRQAVKIFRKSYDASDTFKWKFQVVCDLLEGKFDINIDLVLD